MNKHIAPSSFLELLKDVYLHIDDKYYPRFSNKDYNAKQCDFSKIKYKIDFVHNFDDFLIYYKKNIYGKSCFVTCSLYFDIFYNYNGLGKRVRLSSFVVDDYFNDKVGFGKI